ncbi:MAG TPA: choice-of-anchor tandem repeat GloVer-containing protein [Rhizomicrobium sp.]|jgi:uncharacterized repeat protein (TIGR03803 family)
MRQTVASFLKASAACAIVLVLSAAASAAHAGKLRVLYEFAGMPDGEQPQGNLLQDSAGNLYGTTIVGGNKGCSQGAGCGTVFKIAPDGTESVLIAFDRKKNGGEPEAGLIADSAGNLYGTTLLGGDPICDDGQGCGAVFKLAPDGTETILHAFQWGTDGGFPMAPVVADGKGNLFGVTAEGGDTITYCNGYGGCGVAFKIAADGTETILHRFAGGYEGRGDGAYPAGRLWIDARGNIYGTTQQGGVNCLGDGYGGCGTVFEITRDGQEKVLYSFCSQSGCADGLQPLAGVIEDSAGNLYGTTTYGGNPYCPQGCGVVFELGAGGAFKVLHTFEDTDFGMHDGAYPVADLTADASGNLYGTTYAGGDTGCGGGGCGSVFEISNDGVESVLYGFDRKKGGRFPRSGLLLDNAGHFFGTTAAGGAQCRQRAGCGTVFEFTR